MFPNETVEHTQAQDGDLMAPCVANEVRNLLAIVDAERLIAERRESRAWKVIDDFEAKAALLPQEPCPIDHVFTPGLYTRIIHMRAGSLITSKIHLYEHPYVVAQGSASVWDIDTGWHFIRAPHCGVTKPATRRLLYIHEDCVWMTHHVTDETDPEKIMDAITFDHMKLGHMDSVPPERMAEMRLNQKGELR